jgi:predicted phage terminase large subunit-like protein
LIRRLDRIAPPSSPTSPTSSATPTNDALELGFTGWLEKHFPKHRTDWNHTKKLRRALLDVTKGRVDRLAIAMPAQHGKTRSVTVAYAAWRMMRDPGLRVGIGSHTQRYANKISKWIRQMVVAAGGVLGADRRADEWCLTNGSTMVARGVGGSIAGESIDLFMMDDVFGSREDADSVTTQEKVYEWYMDDVTPRLQEKAALVMVNTRWNPGDLIGRIQQSEEWPEWVYLRITAIAETQEERDRNNASQGLPPGLPDFIDRQPGEALCPERFSIEKLLQKQRIEGVGFEAVYQQNPIPRGGTFFERRWLLGSNGKPLVKSLAELPILSMIPFGRRLVRYWDLAACLVAGTIIETSGGPRPIERVRAGDMVLTRQGYKRVRKAWLTKYVDEVTSVRFSNGSVVTGTGDHRVWTENRGWVPLDSLTSGDYATSIASGGSVWKIGESECLVSRTQKWSPSTGFTTPVAPVASISRRCDGTSSGSVITLNRCTKPSGSFTTGRFPKATTFTTRMTTTTTTSSITWNCLREAITQNCTTGSRSTTALPRRRSIATALANWCGSVPFTSRTSASIVPASSSRGERFRHGSVPRSAGTRFATRPRSVPVYDLEVEGAHEFFANGILVHNSRHDSACYTSGVLLMKLGDGEHAEYWVCDVVRGRWMPAERNEKMRQVAEQDSLIYGFEKTWFEQPVFDKGKAASRAIYAALSGYPVSADNVSGSGSKELRAEPVAGAAKGGVLKIVDGGWNPAFLTEIESFPRSTYKDQVDSLSGAFNRLSRGGFAAAVG